MTNVRPLPVLGVPLTFNGNARVMGVAFLKRALFFSERFASETLRCERGGWGGGLGEKAVMEAAIG